MNRYLNSWNYIDVLQVIDPDSKPENPVSGIKPYNLGNHRPFKLRSYPDLFFWIQMRNFHKHNFVDHLSSSGYYT